MIIFRAKEFLLELFNCKIRHIETYKGKTLSSEKYYMIYDDGREDAYIGGIWYGLSKLINPFRKKTRKISTWQFDISKGCFVNCEPKVFTPEAVEVIDISEGCYIEILEKNYAYTYNVMELYFDDYFGIYYWAPMINVQKSGFYDTKENAIISAKAVLKDNIQL